VLRAWENRYGLLQPVRSPGGFRLYSEADQWRIRQMQAYLAEGCPRPARGAGRWLEERARAAGPARLPARRAARFGADDFGIVLHRNG